MKQVAALAISVSMLLAQSDRAPLHSVTAVRNWSLSDVTRIAIEVSGDFHFKTDRLHNPERIYFDILNSRPRIDARRIWSREINDRLVQRVRAAETNPGTTRIVIDLAGAVEVTTSQLSNPSRLIVEVRAGGGPTIPTEGLPEMRPLVPVRTDPPIKAEIPKIEPPPVMKPPVKTAARADVKPDVKSEVKLDPPVQPISAELPIERPSVPVPLPVQLPVQLREVPRPAVVKADPPVPAPPATSAEFGKAARHTASGGSSLTRALGLKITRVVIDAGHGGHDQGTQGPHGLIEKELVLDVALRVGKLIEERMNAEVIYTRSDDTFVPLEGRTAIANDKKADLFLSIHANSSPYPRISGVETFYLNFTDSKDALDVASRENASSQKSIFELQDIIHKITLHEKLDESREFAGRMQASLFSLSSRNVAGQKNRGVKKAPFVVLIGANMPSVLAEIGFVSNPREEVLLKKSDYRQKLADALYRGVSKYAEGLSHFQMAQN
ncbi:MAG: N-acetylmuramoyl-L-alanine amidase [Candidatus Solibacter sp.]|jgi:N-acetylmuramoyl-L-alanine amidase|nr:N-acetylmuramoyl-L-alanine amidase [Candidatus Solibacter sp.]